MPGKKLGNHTLRPTSPRPFRPQTRPPGVINRAKQTQLSNTQNQPKQSLDNDLRGIRPNSHREQTNPIKPNVLPPAGTGHGRTGWIPRSRNLKVGMMWRIEASIEDLLV